jgi:hypothetical protein
MPAPFDDERQSILDELQAFVPNNPDIAGEDANPVILDPGMTPSDPDVGEGEENPSTPGDEIPDPEPEPDVITVVLGGPRIIWNETPSGVVDGVNAEFTIGHEPVSESSVMLFADGLLLRAGADYDFTISGTTVIFNSNAVPFDGEELKITYTY